ncbi:MAG: hypothetical protein QOH49_632, partial [Acidobacteriota bacterium]|nr:hypothetical protein [Acidobacteriota bacterium]
MKIRERLRMRVEFPVERLEAG